ncbi:hypothetical protein SAMD00019534_049280 [Acytostelium subglobosum LB1]|uniref:hypothetical protein n=1 Tax=Acytostelium subglobosum LB1 TaxID=1410327 RepID=UPI000644EA1E|nr:hypothetical protein SAMD00019534_049280 [Acytostelium subglobosum LB1]GAM21753.1 hypothetical protein SAMD00019534_049280 [Acytostelium subglobosum LB1]|eukprot:XP_012754853.1 hypothetical protein SAMD00019534_049280 [Acytostelium subglobosum LB1]
MNDLPYVERLMKRLIESPDNDTCTLIETPREIAQPFYQTSKEVLDRMLQLQKLGQRVDNTDKIIFAISYYTMALQCYDQHLSMLRQQPSATFKNITWLAACIAEPLAEALSKQNRSPEVVAAGQLANNFDPTVPLLALFNLANGLVQLGDEKQAIQKIKYAHSVIKETQQVHKLPHFNLMYTRLMMCEEYDRRTNVLIKSKIANDKTFEQFPIKMVFDGVGPWCGRKMVASKDISKGTVILRVAPYASTLYDSMKDSLCSVCFQDLKYCKSQACPECKLKFCEMCHTDNVIKQEHVVTCKLLSSVPIKNGADNKWTANTRLAILCLLRAKQNMEGKANKQNTPSTWRKDGLPFIYDTMEDMHNVTFKEEANSNNEEEAESIRMVKTIKDHMLRVKGAKFMNLLNNIPEIYITVLKRLPPNTQVLNDVVTDIGVGIGVFPSAALINHACLANTYSYMDNYGMLVYRSNQDIKAGDEITNIGITETLNSLETRRGTVLQKFNVYCQCKRCIATDSTENQCPKCGQALGKDNLRTWEPQPSIDFDGQVYVCNKGHATMASIYKTLVNECSHSIPLSIMARYYQPNSDIWYRYHLKCALNHMELKENDKALEKYKLVRQHLETVYSPNVKDLMPMVFIGIYTTFLSMALKEDNNQNAIDIIDQLHQHLEDNFHLSTHYYGQKKFESTMLSIKQTLSSIIH